MAKNDTKKPLKQAPNGKVSVAAKKKLSPPSATTGKGITSGPPLPAFNNNSAVPYSYPYTIPHHPSYHLPYQHAYPTQQPYHPPYCYPMMTQIPQKSVPPSLQTRVPIKPPLPMKRAKMPPPAKKATTAVKVLQKAAKFIPKNAGAYVLPKKSPDYAKASAYLPKKAPANLPTKALASAPEVQPELTPMQRKYKCMAGLNMNLDPGNEEATKQRHELLLELLRFEEQERKDSRPTVKITRAGRVAHTVLCVQGLTEIVTKPLPDYSQRKEQLHRDCTNFLHALQPKKRDAEDSSTTKDQPKDTAVTTLCQWLADYYPERLLAETDRATARKAQLNVTMHDGGDRRNPAKAAQWNVMYEKLVAFHREHGHCRVPKRRNRPGLDEEERKLGAWVWCQRRKRKARPALSPQRVALLDKLGFTWEITARKFVDDARIWNAIAVRMCFPLTSREALLLAGFGTEEASKQTTGLNLKIWALTKWGRSIVNQDKVEAIMERLRDDPENTALDEIFGKENATLLDFRRKGKLVLIPTGTLPDSVEVPEEEEEEMEDSTEDP